jgi:hypothetical protein
MLCYSFFTNKWVNFFDAAGISELPCDGQGYFSVPSRVAFLYHLLWAPAAWLYRKFFEEAFVCYPTDITPDLIFFSYHNVSKITTCQASMIVACSRLF